MSEEKAQGGYVRRGLRAFAEHVCQIALEGSGLVYTSVAPAPAPVPEPPSPPEPSS